MYEKCSITIKPYTFFVYRWLRIIRFKDVNYFILSRLYNYISTNSIKSQVKSVWMEEKRLHVDAWFCIYVIRIRQSDVNHYVAFFTVDLVRLGSVPVWPQTVSFFDEYTLSTPRRKSLIHSTQSDFHTDVSSGPRPQPSLMINPQSTDQTKKIEYSDSDINRAVVKHHGVVARPIRVCTNANVSLGNSYFPIIA